MGGWVCVLEKAIRGVRRAFRWWWGGVVVGGRGGYLQLQAAACTLVNCNEMFAESSLFVAARLDDAAPLPPPTIIFFYMQKSPPAPLHHTVSAGV